MTRIFLSLLFLGFCTIASAQTLIQKGLVREQNSGKQAIPAVEIIFEGASATYSDGAGHFRLAFQDKQPGDLIFKESIRKKGYELVNEKDFEIVKIGKTDQLGVDIILAKAGTVDAAKKEYYEVSDAALLASLDREKNALRKQLQEAKINAEKYQTNLQALNEQYDIQKATLDELSEKFSRVNFDDVEPYYEEALKLFKAGKIDEAIQTLEGADPAKRTQQIIAEEKRIKLAQAELDSQKVTLAKEKKKQIEAVRLLADMYSLKFNPVKAEQQYDQLVQLDSTDLIVLSEASDFYKWQHRYKKAISTYSKLYKHPEIQAWEKILVYSHLGDIYSNLGDLQEAIHFYKKCFSYAAIQVENHPTSLLYKNLYANAYQYLGETYLFYGILDSALFWFKGFNTFYQELLNIKPSNPDYTNGLAVSSQYIGEVYFAKGMLDSALFYYRKDLVLTKRLFLYFPKVKEFKKGLAISYEKLGIALVAKGELDSAITYFKKEKDILENLVDSNPNEADFKKNLAIVHEKLGDTYFSKGWTIDGINHYRAEKQLFQELADLYPENSTFKNALGISYSKIGGYFAYLGKLDSSIYYNTAYQQLEKELVIAFPGNPVFQTNYATSSGMLGDIYYSKDNIPKALELYQEGLKEQRILSEAYPSAPNYKNQLSLFHSKLGELYYNSNRLDSALFHYTAYLEINKSLHEAFPLNVNYKHSLAVAYFGLGRYYLESDRIIAMSYIEQSERVFYELTLSYPNNMEFQRKLNTIQTILSRF